MPMMRSFAYMSEAVKRKPRQDPLDNAEAPFELVCFGVFTNRVGLLTMPLGPGYKRYSSCFLRFFEKLLADTETFLICQRK